MPTSNPRVNVTLPPSLDALVGQLAKLQRASKSQVLRELLEAAEPALQRAVMLMQAASQATEAMKGQIRRSLDAAIPQAESALDAHLADMERATQDLVTVAQAVRSRRPARGGLPPSPAGAAASRRAPAGRPGKVPDPPSSNRGVKSPRRGSKP